MLMGFIHFRGLLISLCSIFPSLSPNLFTFQDNLPSPQFNSSHLTNSQTSIINTLRQRSSIHLCITTPLSHTLKSSHPQSHPQTVHQPIFTLPEIPESNYFYPDGRAARFRFPTPPDQTTGHRQSSGNHEPAPPNATQSPARITQVTASQPALPGPSSGEYNNHLVDEKLVRLVGAFELLRDMYVDIMRRLDS